MGVALVDVIAGLGAAVAILAALAARERSGAGQRIEIDLLSSALAALVNQASGYLNAGAVPHRLGNVHPSIEPFATYAAADGPLMICAGNDRQFAALAEALGSPELAADDRFADQPGAGREPRRPAASCSSAGSPRRIGGRVGARLRRGGRSGRARSTTSPAPSSSPRVSGSSRSTSTTGCGPCARPLGLRGDPARHPPPAARASTSTATRSAPGSPARRA